MKLPLTSLAFACAALAAAATPAAAQYATATDYPALVKEFVADDFRFDPIGATSQGNHEHDREVGDFSPAGHEAHAKMLHAYLDAFGKLDPASLAPKDKDDLEWIVSTIKEGLLDEEKLKRWAINPDFYGDAVTGAVFVLIERNFAAPEIRLQDVIAREKLLPGVLKQAQTILDHPAQIFTQIAELQIDGEIDFFTKDLPSAFTDVHDQALLGQFKTSNASVIAALQDFKSFLKKIEPASTTPFAIGRDLYQQKLADAEMVDLPVEKILSVGETQLHRDQTAQATAAHAINPKASLADVATSIEKEHVAANQLVATAQSQLANLRQFVIDHKILTVSGTEQPTVAETPPFMRATTFASMDPPGPLETAGRRAFYYVTLPEPGWDAAKTEEYMQGYNTPLLQNVTVHEVWPGHFVQYLFESTPDMSLVRKLFNANTTVEGWAHYSEQMMVEQGLGGGDPKVKFMQLEDALLRDCRLIAGIKMHTQGMTVDDARDLFVKECHQQPVVAEMEAHRGTEDPTYLVYTLGKLGILKLRADYKAKMGKAFTLQDFHDRFNAAGMIPLKLIRRELMGKDGPLL